MIEYGNVCDAISSWNGTWDVRNYCVFILRFVLQKKNLTLYKNSVRISPT